MFSGFSAPASASRALLWKRKSINHGSLRGFTFSSPTLGFCYFLSRSGSTWRRFLILQERNFVVGRGNYDEGGKGEVKFLRRN